MTGTPLADLWDSFAPALPKGTDLSVARRAFYAGAWHALERLHGTRGIQLTNRYRVLRLELQKHLEAIQAGKIGPIKGA